MKVSVVSIALGLALGAPALLAAQAPTTPAPTTAAPAAEQQPATTPGTPPAITTPGTQPPQPFPQSMRVGVIDMLRVFGDTAWGKTAQQRIDSLGQKKTAELSERQKKLATDNQKLETDVLNEAARRETQASVQRQEKELQRAQQDAQEEFNQLRQEVQESFNAKLGPILQTLVNEKKITMLFRTTDSGLVFFDQSLDLTAEVIKRFDAVNPAAASTTPGTSTPAAPGSTAAPGTTATPPASTPPATPPATPAPKPTTPAPKPQPKD
jgi:outer membrane protein